MKKSFIRFLFPVYCLLFIITAPAFAYHAGSGGCAPCNAADNCGPWNMNYGCECDINVAARAFCLTSGGDICATITNMPESFLCGACPSWSTGFYGFSGSCSLFAPPPPPPPPPPYPTPSYPTPSYPTPSYPTPSYPTPSYPTPTGGTGIAASIGLPPEPGGRTITSPTGLPSQIVSVFLPAVITILGFLTVFYIIFAGIRFIISKGDPEKVAEARSRLTYAIVGFIILLLAFALTQLIDRLFLNSGAI